MHPLRAVGIDRRLSQQTMPPLLCGALGTFPFIPLAQISMMSPAIYNQGRLPRCLNKFQPFSSQSHDEVVTF